MINDRTGAATAAPVRRVSILIVGSGGNAIGVRVIGLHYRSNAGIARRKR